MKQSNGFLHSTSSECAINSVLGVPKYSPGLFYLDTEKIVYERRLTNEEMEARQALGYEYGMFGWDGELLCCATNRYLAHKTAREHGCTVLSIH